MVCLADACGIRSGGVDTGAVGASAGAVRLDAGVVDIGTDALPAASASTVFSSWATRSASESNVRSDLGRAIRVRATSRARRWLVATRISLETSLMTARARATRSGAPKASASSLSCRSSSPATGSVDAPSPTTLAT